MTVWHHNLLTRRSSRSHLQSLGQIWVVKYKLRIICIIRAAVTNVTGSDIRRGDDITQQSLPSGRVTVYRWTGSPVGSGRVQVDTMPSCHTGQSILLPTGHPPVIGHFTNLAGVRESFISWRHTPRKDVYIPSIYSRKSCDCDILKMFILISPSETLLSHTLIH